MCYPSKIEGVLVAGLRRVASVASEDIEILDARTCSGKALDVAQCGAVLDIYICHYPWSSPANHGGVQSRGPHWLHLCLWAERRVNQKHMVGAGHSDRITHATTETGLSCNAARLRRRHNSLHQNALATPSHTCTLIRNTSNGECVRRELRMYYNRAVRPHLCASIQQLPMS